MAARAAPLLPEASVATTGTRWRPGARVGRVKGEDMPGASMPDMTPASEPMKWLSELRSMSRRRDSMPTGWTAVSVGRMAEEEGEETMTVGLAVSLRRGAL